MYLRVVRDQLEQHGSGPFPQGSWLVWKIWKSIVVVLTIVFSCIGMIYNYRMSRNVFGMISTPWYPIGKFSIGYQTHIRSHRSSEPTKYYLTLAWVWQVSYVMQSTLMNGTKHGTALTTHPLNSHKIFPYTHVK